MALVSALNALERGRADVIEATSSKMTTMAGALAALAAVSTAFAGAGVVGSGLGIDVWPDWSGSPRPQADVAAASPDRPGTNPLLPLVAGSFGTRPLGGAAAVFAAGAPDQAAAPSVPAGRTLVAAFPSPVRGAASTRPGTASTPGRRRASSGTSARRPAPGTTGNGTDPAPAAPPATAATASPASATTATVPTAAPAQVVTAAARPVTTVRPATVPSAQVSVTTRAPTSSAPQVTVTPSHGGRPGTTIAAPSITATPSVGVPSGAVAVGLSGGGAKGGGGGNAGGSGHGGGPHG